MAVVLAGANMGSQSADLRSESRSTGYFRAHVEHGKNHFWRHRSGRILCGGRRCGVFVVPSKNEERFSAHEPAAIFANGVPVADHAGIAAENGTAASLAHQVCVDYALVQCVKSVVGRWSSVVGQPKPKMSYEL